MTLVNHKDGSWGDPASGLHGRYLLVISRCRVGAMYQHGPVVRVLVRVRVMVQVRVREMCHILVHGGTPNTSPCRCITWWCVACL